MTDAHYTDNLALLVNTAAQAESLLHSQEQPDIGLYWNSNKSLCVLNKKEPSLSTKISGPGHILRQ